MMDRQKSRKGHERRRFTCDAIDFTINGRDSAYHEKNISKRCSPNDKKKYEISPNSYMINWPPQARMHSIPQRQFSTSDSSVCHYSVPLSFSFEPVSLPIYPTLIQPQGNCAVSLDVESHSNRSKYHKSCSKRRQGKANSIDQNDTPAIFQTPRISNAGQQDYTSLPPVNCDMYTAKISDAEAASKRRFSDPGIGQLSSDESSSSRFDDSRDSSGTPDIHAQDFFSLLEQINDLRENNSNLKKELQETKLELESLKIQSQGWKIGGDSKPGDISDAISEIRCAVKLGEEALVSKVILMLEKNSAEWKEAQGKLEQKLKQEVHERLSKVEEQLNKASVQETNPENPASETDEESTKALQQQLVEHKQEISQLKKKLQETVAKKELAEATAEKSERLVAILRKKVNGICLDSCIQDDKHILFRPLGTSLEKNPFIIANNRQGQRPDGFPFSKAKTFRAFPVENTEEGNNVVSENKENEAVQSGMGNGNMGSNTNNPNPETPSVTAQVTITGPVTDL